VLVENNLFRVSFPSAFQDQDSHAKNRLHSIIQSLAP
jgi:hypothetical protein